MKEAQAVVDAYDQHRANLSEGIGVVSGAALREAVDALRAKLNDGQGTGIEASKAGAPCALDGPKIPQPTECPRCKNDLSKCPKTAEAVPEVRPQPISEPADTELQKRRFWVAWNDFNDYCGHAPSMLDMWLIGRGEMDTTGRAAHPISEQGSDRVRLPTWDDVRHTFGVLLTAIRHRSGPFNLDDAVALIDECCEDDGVVKDLRAALATSERPSEPPEGSEGQCVPMGSPPSSTVSSSGSAPSGAPRGAKP